MLCYRRLCLWSTCCQTDSDVCAFVVFSRVLLTGRCSAQGGSAAPAFSPSKALPNQAPAAATWHRLAATSLLRTAKSDVFCSRRQAFLLMFELPLVGNSRLCAACQSHPVLVPVWLPPGRCLFVCDRHGSMRLAVHPVRHTLGEH